MNLYLQTKSSLSIDPNPDTEILWDRQNTITSWKIGDVFTKNDPNDYRVPMPVGFDAEVGDMVYVVVAIWSDGDSFGNDRGRNCEPFGCYQNKRDALKEVERLNSLDSDDSSPWNGYFESLDSLEVIARAVKG